MNNQKLIIYEFEELYRILIEIKNDVNLIIKKASKNDISDFISQPYMRLGNIIKTQKSYLTFFLCFRIIYMSFILCLK